MSPSSIPSFVRLFTGFISGPLVARTNKLAVEVLKTAQGRAFNEPPSRHREAVTNKRRESVNSRRRLNEAYRFISSFPS